MFLRKIAVSSRENGDFVVFRIGGFTPLDRLMNHADWRGVCDGVKTAAGLFWPMPTTLSTGRRMADRVKTGSEVALTDGEAGEVLAIVKVSEKYEEDPTDP